MDRLRDFDRGGSYGDREEVEVLTTVELFAGIGGFHMAADAEGLETVWANDVNPDAGAVYRDRFGADRFVLGDLATLLDRVPPHDILTAGFPCQPFSSAGRKAGLADERAATFDCTVRLIEQMKPAAFVLENVRTLLQSGGGRHMPAMVETLVGAGYRVEWRLVNATDFGLAQNRKRLVIVGFRHSHPTARIPVLATPDELRPEPATGGLPEWGLATPGEKTIVSRIGALALQTPPPLSLILDPVVDDKYDFTASTLARIEASDPVNRFVEGVEVLWNQRGGSRMGYTIYGTRGVAPTLTSTTSRHYERFSTGDSFRRLTPREYARLQGFPDDHCDIVRHSQRYVLYGNAIPPPMARWGLRRVISALGSREVSDVEAEEIA